MELFRHTWQAKIAIVLFVLLTIWWIVLFISGVHEESPNYIFGATYGLMALWGGVWGVSTSMKWGGLKSAMGRAILFLALGLLAEEFGQLVFSYYNIFAQVEVPYPSLADIGFFGNIPLYIVGVLYIGKVSGAQVTLSRISGKLQMILIPTLILSLSYFFFLQNYEFDWSNPLKIFLDFGYPLGQAVYISLTLLIYSLSRNMLGGVMRSRIIFILIAFIAQYSADYNFLFQSSRGTWYNAGYGDYLYLIAYFLMALALLELKTLSNTLKTKGT